MSVIDDYLAGYSGAHRSRLDELVALIRGLVPQGTIEKLSWQMPTFWLNGNLVHVAAGKNHVGFYPGSAGVEFAAAELNRLGLKYSKGAIQFRLDEPLPAELITRIVQYRIEQQLAK